MPDVAYVTSLPDPEDVDIDVEVARSALRERGLSVGVERWDDPSVDWSSYALVVVRSPWDYTERHDEFLGWATAVDAVTKLRNPLAVLVENTDKRYLRTLEAAGVPIVPTRWAEPALDVEPVVAASLAEHERVVVKPNVSAGARDTLLTGSRADAVAQARAIQESGRAVMVQPYLPAVEAEGETAVVVLGDDVSHAIRKVPALTEGGHGWAAGAVEITDEVRSLVDLTLAAVPARDQLVYARVDVVRDDSGRLVLMELELTEPCLFLPYDDSAPARFAASVASALG